MKNGQRIDRLYESLSNRERAVLAFRYLVNLNEGELERVRQSVPRKVYECSDEEFTGLFDSLYHMSCWFAVERSRIFGSVLSVLFDLHNCEDSSRSLGAVFHALDRSLASLDAGLLVVCKRYNIDPDPVQRMSATDLSVRLFTGTNPDPEYQAAVEECLGRFLELQDPINFPGAPGIR